MTKAIVTMKSGKEAVKADYNMGDALGIVHEIEGRRVETGNKILEKNGNHYYEIRKDYSVSTLGTKVFAVRKTDNIGTYVKWTVSGVNEATKKVLIDNGFNGTLSDMRIIGRTQEECDVINAKISSLIEAKVLSK